MLLPRCYTRRQASDLERGSPAAPGVSRLGAESGDRYNSPTPHRRTVTHGVTLPHSESSSIRSGCTMALSGQREAENGHSCDADSRRGPTDYPGSC
jgi:hypothetical protein